MISSRSSSFSSGEDDFSHVDIAPQLVGCSSALTEIRKLIDYAAASPISVMITGPSGCGKEVVAKSLHYRSSRSDGNFVAVNCGAIPSDLLESELFGHEKGSFSGAIAKRKGRFEIADGGTLFLDEIGDMPFDMQVKLLRVLEEKQFERIGGTESIAVDVRVISATHRNLDQAITNATFREDLFYRLSVFPIDIPPLHRRRKDIVPLVQHFLNDIADGQNAPSFSPAALKELEEYHWPGNAREMRNIVERAVLLFPGMMIGAEQTLSLFRRRASTAPSSQIDALPASYPGAKHKKTRLKNPIRNIPNTDEITSRFDLKRHLMDEERRYMLSALKIAEGVVTEAANLVSLRRTTFVEKMKRHKIVRKMALEQDAPSQFEANN